MGKPVETVTVRVLLLQIVSHALIFAILNAGGFVEQVFLVADTVAAASLGLSWTVFRLLYAFPANVVNVCPLVVGRRTGDGDDAGARAAVGQAMLLAGAVGAGGIAMMGLLVVFFLFDFAINFLSALLKAAKEHAYLLKATMVAACAFGLLLVAMPSPMDGACLMGAFITAQAAWAMLLIIKVATRWPVASL